MTSLQLTNFIFKILAMGKESKRKQAFVAFSLEKKMATSEMVYPQDYVE